MFRVKILLLAVVFACSCGRKKQLGGIVVTPAGIPVADASVDLIYRQGASSFSDGQDDVYRLGTTDFEGRFAGEKRFRKKEYIISFRVTLPDQGGRSIDFSDPGGPEMRFVIP